MVISLSAGVAPLLRLLGESALTVELTIDFEHDVRKSAVVFPGAAEEGLGFERVKVDGLDVVAPAPRRGPSRLPFKPREVVAVYPL